MTRPDRQKLLYIAILTALGLACAGVVTALHFTPLTVSCVAIALLIPGRLGAAAFRSFYLGRKAMGDQRFSDAIQLFEQFRRDIRKAPWKKRFIWFAWPIYTLDVEAMTLNNLGAANLELGRWDEAERYFGEALERDSCYSIPHFNLAVLAKLRREEALASEHAVESSRLGFRGSASDRIATKAAALYARFQSIGATAP